MDVMLRAPTRKRKTPDVALRPRVIKMTWDVDPESTAALMRDVGVSLLDNEQPKEETVSFEKGSKLTPFITNSNDIPPGAPKVVSGVQVRRLPINETPASGSNFGMSPLMLCIDSQLANGQPSKVVSRSTGLSSFINDMWCFLSDEMILSIFCWLSKATLARCAQVCKRWRAIVYDESLWKALDLGGKTLKKGACGHILERGVCVLRLAKSEILTPIHTHHSSLGQSRFYKVKYLDLSMATISCQGLEEILSNCYDLRRLSLENCDVNNNICRYIGQNQNLEVLNLSMCQGLSENALVPICNNLHKLDSLNIAWTNMSRGAIVYLVISLPATITRLNLSGCRDRLQDEDVLQLCGSCPHLSELDLSDASILTSQSIDHIICHLSWLQYLALSRCYKISLRSLAALTNCRMLQALDVFGMLKEAALSLLSDLLTEKKPNFKLNKCPYSSIARPTTGRERTKIWMLRTRDRVL